MKKRLIKSLYLFCILMFVILSNAVLFGKYNIIVGIGGAVGVLVLLKQDIIQGSFKKAILFTLFYISLGITSFLCSFNTVTAFIISFMVLFFIPYIFSYDLRSIKTTPFGLMYVFLIFNPVEISKLPVRILSLIYVALIIIIVQLIMNIKLFKKNIEKPIKAQLKLIEKEINTLLEHNDISSLNQTCSQGIHITERSLYRSIRGSLKNSKEAKYKMEVVFFIKKLNSTLHNVRLPDNNLKKILLAVKAYLYYIDLFLNKSVSLEELERRFSSILKDDDRYKEQNYYYLCKFRAVIHGFLNNIKAINNNEKLIYEKKSRQALLGNLENWYRNLRLSFKISNIRINYALKFSLLNSLTIFLILTYNITRGLWLSLTLIVLIQPYVELSKKKALDRIKGTFLGVTIFEIICFIPSSPLKIVVLVISLYMLIYVNNYRDRICFIALCGCVTLSKIHPLGNNAIYGLYRIGFAAIGSLVAIFFVLYVFPCKIEDVTFDLVGKSIDLNKKLINMLYQYNNPNYTQVIQNTILTIHFINTKISVNNNELKNAEIKQFLSLQHSIEHNLHFLNKYIENDKFNDRLYKMLKDLSCYLENNTFKKQFAKENNSKNHNIMIVHLNQLILDLKKLDSIKILLAKV